MWNNPVHRGEAAELLAAALSWLSPQVDALLVLGDLADYPDAGAYRELRSQLRAAEAPAYVIAGNHDLAGPEAASAVLLARAVDTGGLSPRLLTRAILGSWRDAAGSQGSGPAAPVDGWPPHGIGGFELAAGELRPDGMGGFVDARLDRARQAAAGLGSNGGVGVVPPERRPGVAPGRTGPATPSGLSAPGRPLIWASHFPVVSLRRKIEACGWAYAGDLANRRDALAVLRGLARPVVVLSGHLHVRSHAVSGNVLQLGQAALAESPHDASVITLTQGSDGLTVVRRCHCVAKLENCLESAIDPPLTAFVWDGRRWRPGASVRAVEASQSAARAAASAASCSSPSMT
jgi:predicted phosphodiesterase